MKNNEHLALFILGIGTLAVTFLLLFAMNNRDTVGSSIDRQVSGSVAQADVGPVTQAPVPAPPPMNMDVLDQQITETFSKTAAYLAQGKYEEQEHIALLERLEFYSGMSSIKPEHRKTAQDYINDMNRLLTLKESVARRVQVAGQISAVSTDVQVFLSRGVKDEAKAKKLTSRIEALYAIKGLSDSQNQQLRIALVALKNAYTPTATASAQTTHKQTVAPKAQKPAAPVVTAKAEPKPEPKPQAKPAPAPAPAPKAQEPAPAPKPQTVAAAPKPAPKAEDPQNKITRESYYKVMTLVSSYFVERHYKYDYHQMLTSELTDIQKNKKALTAGQQDRLEKTIEKMNRIDERYGPQASAK